MRYEQMPVVTSASKRTVNRRRLIPIMALALGVVMALPAEASKRPGHTIRVSEPLDDTPGSQGASTWSSVSANGRYVAFDSGNDALVRPDANPSTAITGLDVFVFDTRRDEMELVSISSRGIQGVGQSHEPAMTPGGRYVAFSSDVPTLVDGDTNLGDDVFVHDRVTRKTERVSLAPDGSEAPAGSVQPSISYDGRFVAFSGPSDLMPGGSGNGLNVYVRDRRKRTTIRVSVSSAGEAAAGSNNPSISGNGRYIAFTSPASNLVEGDTNAASDVFVHDRISGKTERVSIASDGSEGSAGSGSTHASTAGNGVSSDGRYVVFSSVARNLVPQDTSFYGLSGDVFVRDRKGGQTERLSVTSFGEEADGSSVIGSISGDGRFVSFVSSADNLFHGDTTTPPDIPLADPVEALLCSTAGVCPEEMIREYPFGDLDVFIYDRASGATEPVSIGYDGDEAADCGARQSQSRAPSVSLDGRYISFSSCTANLVRSDSRQWTVWRPYDVFLRDRGPTLGVGGVGGLGGPADQNPPDHRICITDDVCIPPGAAVSSSDATDDLDETLTKQGANLYGASLALRPQYEDLFAAIVLEHMPHVIPGASPIFYGLRFQVEGRSYEVRATSLLGGTFGLFDCTGSPTCTKVTDLRGGYGTTGMRVVLSLPLDEIGLEDGGELKDVTAFSALGNYLSGATTILDQVKLK